MFLLIIQEILLVAMIGLYIGYIPDTLFPKEEIVDVMVKDLKVSLKISSTLPC